MVYQFRTGFQLRGDPQEVGETLERLRVKYGGQLLPRQVLAEASRKGSALHQYFEWNDTEAARKYRLSQAAYLIRAVIVVAAPDDQPFEPVRAFVCIRGSEEQPQAFTHVCEAMRNDELREKVIARAKKELQDWRKRYADLQAFAEVFDAIDSLTAA
jgi:hypothetical protein